MIDDQYCSQETSWNHNFVTAKYKFKSKKKKVGEALIDDLPFPYTHKDSF